MTAEKTSRNTANSTKNRETKMSWNLPELMGRRRIFTATELQRMLRDVGVVVSSAHMSNLVTGLPLRVSDHIMWGLTTVLDCSTDELWSNPDRKPSGERSYEIAQTADTKDDRVAPKPEPDKGGSSLTGPVVRPFPNPKSNRKDSKNN